MKLQTKAESLAAENGSLQSCLDMLLRHLEAVQRDNEAMKGVLLRAAVVSGISAEMEHLEQTIDMHRPPPVRLVQGCPVARVTSGESW